MQRAAPFLLTKAPPPRVPNGKEIEFHLENERHRSGGKRMGKGVAGGVVRGTSKFLFIDCKVKDCTQLFAYAAFYKILYIK